MSKERIKEKLKSAFGDGWYDGFIAAQQMAASGEWIEDVSEDWIRAMSETAEDEFNPEVEEEKVMCSHCNRGKPATNNTEVGALCGHCYKDACDGGL